LHEKSGSHVPVHGAFKGVWTFVTITPYGKDIEPNVPDKHLLIEHFKHLSMQLGVNSIGWRYDPIFLSERYSKDYHLKAFEQIATALEGYTKTVVISFVDLYQKVRRNFPELRMLGKEDRLLLGIIAKELYLRNYSENQEYPHFAIGEVMD